MAKILVHFANKSIWDDILGHILYREAKMTFSRKAFIRIFDN